MQSHSNHQSAEEQSLHSLKLQPHAHSLPQQPHHEPTPSNHHKTIKPPSSKISISSDQSQLSGSEGEQLPIQSLADLHSQQHVKKKPINSTQQNQQNQQKKSQISNFIIKTYRILQEPINSNIIHWTDEGNAFIVKNKDRFENQILPKYFKHKKFSSFVRQLNMYDFHKIRKEKEIPIFKHKYFRQGSIDLLCKIKRKSGEQGCMIGGHDDQEANHVGNEIGTRNYIPSLLDLGEKPMISAYSFKSKSHLPYPSMITSQPSIGLLPGIGAHGSQLQLLIQQNTQLTTSISQLARQQAVLQLQKQRRRQKIMKILSVLTNVDLVESLADNDIMLVKQSHEYSYTDNAEIYNLRDLQNHFISEEEPFSFVQYTSFVKDIHKSVKNNLVRINSEIREETQEECQVDN